MLKKAALTLLLALTTLSSAQSRVLYDPRVPTPEPRLTEQERGRIQYLAEQAMVAYAWDEPAFKPSQMGCDGQDFMINGVAPGSFTARNAQQKAYLYTYCYYRPGWKQGLVIMQGERVVAHYAFTALHSEMYALKDINRNGFTELALGGGFTGQGTTDSYLEIAELAPQRRLLAAFNYVTGHLVWEDNCGAVGEGGTWQALVIRVTPGAAPSFTQQRILGRCTNERVATKTGAILPLKVKPEPTGWKSAPLY